MEENLIKCLKAFATELVDGFRHYCEAEDIVDDFTRKSELALSTWARKELINHLNKIIKK